MSTSQQRWLSLTGICTTLQLSKSHIKYLVKTGVLVSIGIGPGKRYLDPTPEYAAKLRMGETLYGRLFPLPKDIDLCALLTIREVAEITGLAYSTVENYTNLGKLPFKKVGIYRMVTVEAVRKMLWKREDRKLCKQRAPFLLGGIIKFFMDRYHSENEIIPTDTDFREDDELMRRFQRLMKMPEPQRGEAVRELWAKIDVAKAVAEAIQTAPVVSSTPASADDAGDRPSDTPDSSTA